MNDRSDGRDDRGGSQDAREQRDQSDGGHRGGPRENDGRPDTRFLQLELSQMLYAEAQEVVRPAFHELLLEAAKQRLRERFGDKITQLAQLAVDEQLRGFQASLDVEARIREHQEKSPQEQLRDVFVARPGGGETPPQRAAKRERGAARRGKGRR